MRSAFYALSFVTFFIVITAGSSLSAQPHLGAEITWECTPQGNFRFIAKLYRDCKAVDLYATINLESNAPLFSLIQLNRVTIHDISPSCGCPGGNTITCQGPQIPGSRTGAVEVHVYTSDYIYPNGVPLTGVPPATGWHFAYSLCCRANSSNLTIYQESFVYKAVMYPYNNTTVDNCYDNSPVFQEAASSVICAGNNTVLNYNAEDIDSDSLVYEWSPIYFNMSNMVTQYASGYSYNNPFPGTFHNQGNVPAQLDSETGFITLNSLTTGGFLHAIRVSSFRNGIKICEIYREANILITSCPAANVMPVFSHQQPGGSGQVPEYTDTVFAGETVIIPVSVSDSGYCAGTSPPVPQIVYFTAISDHFGPPLNPGGCLVPPCATFNPSPTPGTPVSGTFGVSTVFSWQTGCSHLAESIKQNQHKKTYKFLFKATDSFCPVPLVAFLPVTIVVRDLPAVDPPGMLTLGVDSYGDVHLSWKSTSDTINSFKGYYIYSASNPSAPFSLIDSLMNISDSTYIHAGALAQHNVVCYYISVKSRCFGATERFSDTICGTSVNIPGTAERMQPFSVGLNIPNPAIGTTTIPVIVPEDGIIRLNISDLAGNILLSSFCHVKAGENRVEADVSGLAAGVYFYSVGFNGLRYTRKMIINI